MYLYEFKIKLFMVKYKGEICKYIKMIIFIRVYSFVMNEIIMNRLGFCLLNKYSIIIRFCCGLIFVNLLVFFLRINIFFNDCIL